MKRLSLIGCLVVGLLVAGIALWPHLFAPTSGAGIGTRGVKLATAQSGAHTTYDLTFNGSGPTPMGSVSVQFCADGPLADTTCTAPAGFDASNVSLGAQTGPGNFNISAADSTSNRIVLNRTVAVNAGMMGFTFSNITNPSTPGSYYVRLQTYNSGNATGPARTTGGIAFAITNNINITAEVPPYLVFCTGITIGGQNCSNAVGNYIDFGELDPLQARHATSQMVVATNAESGYNITIDGTTLTSGNNEIDALFGGDVSRPGTPQFGLNLRSNATPSGGSNPSGPGVSTPQPNYNIPNVYRFNRGEMVVSNPSPDDVREYTVSYIANVSRRQSAGVYVSTITYICLASF